MCFIFNKCVESSKIPTIWKLAHIIPVPKGNKDFRPISLLCTPAKIFEKLLIKRYILPSLKRNLSSNQFAFISNAFTGSTLALCKIRLWCMLKLDSIGGSVRLVAVEFKKAFDKVSHFKLLQTLKDEYQFECCCSELLKNYLCDRKQRVL